MSIANNRTEGIMDHQFRFTARDINAALVILFPPGVKGLFNPEIHKASAMERLKNTCWLWREDGPLMEKLKLDRK